MTEDSPKPKIRVSVIIWWVYVLAALVVLFVVAQRIFPALATEYRLSGFEYFCIALLPAFALCLPGFFLRRLRLGQMGVTFVTVVVAGLVSLAIARFAFYKKLTDEANQLATQTLALFNKAAAPLAEPTAPPAPSVTLWPALTPTPTTTPTPFGTPTPTPTVPRAAANQTPTPTVTATPLPTLPPFDAAEVQKQVTETAVFDLAKIRAEYQAAVIAGGSARLLSPERLGTDRSMDGGKKMVDQLLAANDAFREKQRAWLDALLPKLDALYIPDVERAAMKKSFLATSNRTRGMVDNYWNAEKKFLGEVTNLFTMLKESNDWGVENGKFTFSDAGFATDFNKKLLKFPPLSTDREQSLLDSQASLKQTLNDMFTAAAAAAAEAAAAAAAAAEAAAAQAATGTPVPGASPVPGAAPAPTTPPAPGAVPVPTVTPTPVPAPR
ncbi:hypothetical protein AYO41_00790 [Verrucomicrobia bacterium SCGC AG-212-E04]|nr:hypothetical protein AYO41_00790 [Verrucomicrobia bacterium SCGC AG-212-E04]